MDGKGKAGSKVHLTFWPSPGTTWNWVLISQSRRREFEDSSGEDSTQNFLVHFVPGVRGVDDEKLEETTLLTTSTEQVAMRRVCKCARVQDCE